MRFRPCIDIHNGQVKQIVGGSLQDAGDRARENFASSMDAAFYARLYQRDHLAGGHVIMLNPVSSPYYEATKAQAAAALQAAPGFLQIGGGINPENAEQFLQMGASHVIVTSYVFRNGMVDFAALEKMRQTVGQAHLVLDLSCRMQDGVYYIVTDRWQRFTNVPVSRDTMEKLRGYCDEFLVHGVDVEGMQRGPALDLLAELADFAACNETAVTYAGGIASFGDLQDIRKKGRDLIDFTVGSALDLFGGNLSYRELIKYV